ncbi:MAG: EAL domain-containing protein [Treponema sp.]|nr:EAL domain-containing protein [Treponema sp.]
MKFLKQNTLLLTFFTIICISGIFLPDLINRIFPPVIHIGSMVMLLNSLNGVLSALFSIFYISLVFINYQKGIKIAISIMTVSFLKTVFAMISQHTLNPLPGILMLLVSFISTIIIYFFYKRMAVSAYTDFITGLNNRRSYVEEINSRIKDKQAFTVACIEMEDFKHINDSYGIQSGDFLLRKIAEKLNSITNKGDMVFRITGATFAILFKPGESPEERLKSIIKAEVMMIPPKPTEDETLEINSLVSLAAGMTYCYPPYNSKKDATAILKEAETALAATRNLSSKKICIYNETMENAEIKQREAEFLIKEALEKNYFYLVYQPQYTTDEKKLRGFETLIRCRKPDGSIVSPNFFIPYAEKSNLIIKIDDFVLRNAMTEFKPVMDNSDNDFIISINVSAKNIGSSDFSKRIKNLIEEIQFPAERLEIEITEYSFAESMETTIANIKELKAMGIQIALDDFGTGYTSIAQLMKLPINLLKIDKSLIDDIEENQDMRDMVDSVIYMGHIMKCEVISEGVENENQIELLRKHKCDFIQGFVWGKPQSFADAELLAQQEDY